VPRTSQCQLFAELAIEQPPSLRLKRFNVKLYHFIPADCSAAGEHKSLLAGSDEQLTLDLID
jgi:hypothetical protein